MSDTDTMKQVYLLAQEHCGLKVGDFVRVTRKAESNEAGWDNPWIPDMNVAVGAVGKVNSLRMFGVNVCFPRPIFNAWNFPYFVLEKVERPVHEFKPYDPVLTLISGIWRPNIFLYERASGLYQCAYGDWEIIIPYKGNEHLVGTTDKLEE